MKSLENDFGIPTQDVDELHKVQSELIEVICLFLYR